MGHKNLHQLIVPEGTEVRLSSEDLQKKNINRETLKKLQNIGIDYDWTDNTLLTGIPGKDGFCGIYAIWPGFVLVVTPKTVNSISYAEYNDGRWRVTYPKLVKKGVVDLECVRKELGQTSAFLSKGQFHPFDCHREALDWFNLSLMGQSAVSEADRVEYQMNGPFVWYLTALIRPHVEALERSIRSFYVWKSDSAVNIRGRIDFAATIRSNVGLEHKHAIVFSSFEHEHIIFSFIISCLKYLRRVVETHFQEIPLGLSDSFARMFRALSQFYGLQSLAAGVSEISRLLNRWPRALMDIRPLVVNMMRLARNNESDERNEYLAGETLVFGASATFQKLCNSLLRSACNDSDYRLQNNEIISLRTAFGETVDRKPDHIIRDLRQNSIRWILDSKYTPINFQDHWDQMLVYQELSLTGKKGIDVLRPICFLLFAVSTESIGNCKNIFVDGEEKDVIPDNWIIAFKAKTSSRKADQSSPGRLYLFTCDATDLDHLSFERHLPYGGVESCDNKKQTGSIAIVEILVNVSGLLRIRELESVENVTYSGETALELTFSSKAGRVVRNVFELIENRLREYFDLKKNSLEG